MKTYYPEEKRIHYYFDNEIENFHLNTARADEKASLNTPENNQCIYLYNGFRYYRERSKTSFDECINK